MDPLDWLARLSDHIPDAGQHRTAEPSVLRVNTIGRSSETTLRVGVLPASDRWRHARRALAEACPCGGHQHDRLRSGHRQGRSASGRHPCRIHLYSSADDKTSIGVVSPPTGPDGKFQIVDVPAGECWFGALPESGRVRICLPGDPSCGGPTSAIMTIRQGVNVHNVALKTPCASSPSRWDGIRASRDARGVGLSEYIVYADCGTDCSTTGPDCHSLGGIVTGPDGRFQDRLPVGPCRVRACPLDSSGEYGECMVKKIGGPCAAGEPCADVTVSATSPITDLTLRLGASR